MDLTNRVALITGGARMGESIGALLAQHGCDVALTYRRSKRSALKAKRRIQASGGRTLLIQADVNQTKSHKKIRDAVRKYFGRLDLLVHGASIYEKTKLSRLSVRQWNRSMDIHVNSARDLTLTMRPLLKKQGGRIVFVSDWTAASGRPRYKDYVPYYVSKSAALALTEALALELAPEILVNAVAPGPIMPPPGMSKKECLEVTCVTPLQRWGGPDEIAKAVVFFAESDFVTGECIRVDGGRHLY